MIGRGNRSDLSEHLALLSILIGVLFWIGESLVHVLAFRGPGLIKEILNPDPHEIATRTAFLTIILLFGFLAQTLTSKRRKAEEVLQESHEVALSPSQATESQGEQSEWGVSLGSFELGLPSLLERLCSRPGRWILIAEVH